MKSESDIHARLEEARNSRDHADRSRAYYKRMRGQVEALEWVLDLDDEGED